MSRRRAASSKSSACNAALHCAVALSIGCGHLAHGRTTRSVCCVLLLWSTDMGHMHAQKHLLQAARLSTASTWAAFEAAATVHVALYQAAMQALCRICGACTAARRPQERFNAYAYALHACRRTATAWSRAACSSCTEHFACTLVRFWQGARHGRVSRRAIRCAPGRLRSGEDMAARGAARHPPLSRHQGSWAALRLQAPASSQRRQCRPVVVAVARTYRDAHGRAPTADMPGRCRTHS